MSFAIPSTNLNRLNIDGALDCVFFERETDLETEKKIKKLISDYLFSLSSYAQPFEPSKKLPDNILPYECRPAPRSEFRSSKAHLFRALVSHQCREIKEQLLKDITVSQNAFYCVQCKDLILLQYARLAHVIPLKSLWLQFEKESGEEMDSGSDRWQGQGFMAQWWRTFHLNNAVFAVICKDCEKKASS